MGTSANDWTPFYNSTRGRAPRDLVVEAASFVVNVGQAIEVGAGALSDSRYLLAQGFEVTAIDGSELMMQEAATIDSSRFHPVLTTFGDFAFPTECYDLASAQYSIPFNPPETYDALFDRIIASLVPGGIFCGQFFGDRDGWASYPDMTFHSRERAEARLSGLEVIKLQETEEDGSTSVGKAKHWHLFHFIARKSAP